MKRLLAFLLCLLQLLTWSSFPVFAQGLNPIPASVAKYEQCQGGAVEIARCMGELAGTVTEAVLISKGAGLALKTVKGVEAAGTLVKTAEKAAKFVDDAAEAAAVAARKSAQEAAEKAAEKVEKTTKHGQERLVERDFTIQEKKNILSSGKKMVQKDGAEVFIQEGPPGKFNVIVEGQRGTITAFKQIDEQALKNLGRNYGWK